MKRINNIHIPITTIRQEVELNVIAHNCFLKERVNKMLYIALLRNAHPSDRSRFAKQLHQKKIVDKNQLKEFVDID